MNHSLKHRSIMTTADPMVFINPFTYKITLSQVWREATCIRGEILVIRKSLGKHHLVNEEDVLCQRHISRAVDSYRGQLTHPEGSGDLAVTFRVIVF